MSRARVIGIWIAGLISSAVSGFFVSVALLGTAIGNAKVDDGAFAIAILIGAPAGALAFICARLWATTPKMDLPIRRSEQ